jgi:hypothetical protein
LGRFEHFEIVTVARSVAGALHFEQVLQRADPDLEPIDINVFCLFLQLFVSGDLWKPLENIKLPKVGEHQRSVAGPVLLIGVGHDVDVLSSPQIAPGVYRETANQDKTHLRPLSRSSNSRFTDGIGKG